MDSKGPISVEHFTRLLTAHQRRLYGFIYSLVHDHSATEDIAQEVTSILWRKIDQFEAGTDFCAWAFRVARYSVLEWRRAQQKQALLLDEDLLTKLANRAADELSGDHHFRYEALEDCISQLNREDQDLLRKRYEEEESVVAIAKQAGRTRDAVYKVLARVHRNLADCIEEKTKAQFVS